MNEADPRSPTGVVVHDHVQIPMRDGTRLSARIWLPGDAEQRPVPALLEYLPYRKGDWTAPRDAQRHPWYAAAGYASLRVDLRGSGDSEGVMLDEYTDTELQDGLDVIAWMCEQPWCTGSVGMFGISWGGFNSLQVAALRPPALKAIVTVCSTDDRYADDVHYFGGAVLGIDMLAWATTMLAFTARPPDPARVGPSWRSMWDERLRALDPFLDRWLSHQERDDYWRRGSVCEDYGSIQVPVLAVGGWADPYRNTVFRLVENLTCPVKGIVGPWSHQYPDVDRTPGPRIGFLQETLRWWDRWLKGDDTGVEADPALRVWLQDSVPPATQYPTRPGRWVTEPAWPSPNVSPHSLSLADLGCPDATDDWVTVRSPQHAGVDAGRYFPFGNRADLAPDQRAEDGRSCAFTGGALTEPLQLLGRPKVRLRLRAGGDSNVVVRLCDVAPDGSSTLVTRGCLNLSKRAAMDGNTPVVAGEVVEVDVEMAAMAWVFPAGHKLRLAVSTSYWPWIWPKAHSAELYIDCAASRLTLPVRSPDAPSQPVDFGPPEQAPPLAVQVHPRPASSEREVQYRPDTDEWTLTVDPNYGGARTYPDGLIFDEQAEESYSIRASDPLTATATSSWEIRLRRPDWDVQLQVHATMRSDRSHFHTQHDVKALFNGEDVFSNQWTRSILRSST